MTVSPDILLALGVERRKRSSYRTWEEGKVPDFMLEVLSPSTWQRDLAKRETYARLGVREYSCSIRRGSTSSRCRKGTGWTGGDTSHQRGLGPLAVRSRVLGLDRWVGSGRDPRMRDAATGENMRSAEESEAKWREAEAQLEESEVGRREAEARAERAEARLRELEERLKLSR